MEDHGGVAGIVAMKIGPPYQNSRRRAQAGASVVEALLLVCVAVLFVIAGIQTFSTGVSRSYCRASIKLVMARGGGTDEATGPDRAGTDNTERERRRNDSDDNVSEERIDACMAEVRPSRGRSGGGGFQGVR